MIRLFTSFYAESNPTRQKEILECLERNLALPEIDEVCLLVENTAAPLEHSKLKTRPTTKRPEYRDMLDWAKEEQLGPLDLSIVCNSDIYFDSTIAIFETQLRPNQCAALSRWNVNPDGSASLYFHNDSQDTWIFSGAIREFVDTYPIGVPRCDNRIMHDLELLATMLSTHPCL